MTFKNAEGEAFGRLNLRTAFARSCNTAFVNIAQKLPEGALADASKFYGCTMLPGGADTPETLPIPTFTCNAPPATGSAYAATAFGQAQVETSPLGMVSIVAAASTGTWQQPTVVPAGAGEGASPGASAEPSAGSSAEQSAKPRSLSPGVTSALQEAMGAVVSSAPTPGSPDTWGTTRQRSSSRTGVSVARSPPRSPRACCRRLSRPRGRPTVPAGSSS